jgi:hypothetical protein
MYYLGNTDQMDRVSKANVKNGVSLKKMLMTNLLMTSIPAPTKWKILSATVSFCF